MMISSESVALDALKFSNLSDIRPGEAVIITKQGISRRQIIEYAKFTPCIFEYVYLARPDSIMDKISVYKARLAMGEALAEKCVRQLGDDMDVDVIIPVRFLFLSFVYFLNKREK